MSLKFTAIHTAAALVLASSPFTMLGQGPARGPRPRVVAGARGSESSCPGRPRVVRRPARSRRAEGRGVHRPKMDCAEDVVGPSEPARHVVDRRHARHSSRPPGGARHARVLDEQQFVERAKRQQAGSEHAANVQTFHRVAYGTRVFGFSSLVVDPPNGRTPALTADGRARAAAAAGNGSFGPGPFDTFEDFSLYDRCIARSLSAGMNAVLYGNGIVIAQSPDSVTITYEMVHETRVIPLDGRPHLADGLAHTTATRAAVGTATRSSSRPAASRTRRASAPAPNSTSLRTTERIRRVDPDMIEYRITVDDPATYTAPFTVRAIWTVQPGYEVYEYSCHEGNFAVGGGLAGERAYEREVEEARAKGLPIPRRATMAEIYGAPRGRCRGLRHQPRRMRAPAAPSSAPIAEAASPASQDGTARPSDHIFRYKSIGYGWHESCSFKPSR